MTTVLVDLRVGNDVPAAGTITPTPTARHDHDEHIDLPSRPGPTKLIDGQATLELEATGASWCWRIEERIDPNYVHVRYVAVPSTGQLDYRALQDVDPATLDPTDEPEAAWWAALDALYQGVPIYVLPIGAPVPPGAPDPCLIVRT